MKQSHLPCPDCGSSDALSINPRTGWSQCFSCGTKRAPEGVSNREPAEPVERRISTITPVTTVFRALADRGIPADAAKKFKIDVNTNENVDVAHRYPYFKDGQHVGNKVRKRSEKGFWVEGTVNDAELFGQHLFDPGSAKQITLVEGECDAAAAYVLMDSRYPVVSVCNAATAVNDVVRNFEYLNSFENIVVCFDSDSAKVNPLTGQVRYPGQEAANKVASLFAPGKCRVMTMKAGKDANDYLVNSKKADFKKEWWDAPAYMPDKLKLSGDMWDEIINPPNHFQIDYPWQGLNRMTYGHRLSEAVLIMADTGVGKTSIFKEIEYSIINNPAVHEKGYKIGILHLEEPNRDTALGLMSIHANKPYHLPDTPKSDEELRSAFDAVLSSNRAVLYDHFGSNAIDDIINKVRHMAAMGCKYIFIDHLSIIVSNQDGDERKQLDEISTKLKTITMELTIGIFCIVHTNREGQVRGSAGPEQLANIHMALVRDKEEKDPWRRNVTKIVVKKNRFCGRTGPATYLWYNPDTGRLEELDERGIARYEEGGTLRDDERAF